MGKPHTATWINGVLLAVGNLAAVSQAQADYAHYYPQDNGYQLRRAAYQPGRYQNNDQDNRWQAVNVPPPLAPYEPAPVAYAPPPLARQAAVPSAWPMRQMQLAPQPQSARQASITAERKALLDAAYRAIGTTYRWGGNSPREGFDCSGLTKFTHKNVSVNIPRTAAEQSRASRTISRQQLRPGDMIFFKTSGNAVNHVGIYVGNGKFIHAASGGGRVTVDDLRKSYWQKRLYKYGTFLS
ncbi:MAG: C40 family peptidase [Thiolinea sp.]